MQREVITQIKVRLRGGNAVLSSQVRQALRQYGINIAQFCKAFNNGTKGKIGSMLTVVITVYNNKTFSLSIS